MSANPYAPPGARVQDRQSEEVQPIALWSATGRIGRLRLLAYSMVAYFVLGATGALIAVMGGAMRWGLLSSALIAAAAVTYVVFIILQAIKRCHDVNWSGWLSILVMIPFVNLIFGLLLLFMPGTSGPNNYGAPPPPNRGAGVVIACILGGVMVIGILAAIAIPQYQSYVQRAKAAGQTR